MTPGSTSA
uniref:Uncharacterized protein n=1 Tax=Macrostomum lignano TaxID=282301 RepID=A0A1I8H533_9PLAT